jgi:cell division transport system permease protein
MKSYFVRHIQVFIYSLGQLVYTPLASLMTIAVIGITLALPTVFYVAIDNTERLSSGWKGQGQISLFLRREIEDGAARSLVERVQRLAPVAKVEFISSESAFVEFKRLSGFGDTLDSLDRNPLPALLVVHPAATHTHPEAIQALLNELKKYSEVEYAQLDLEWVRRLHAMLSIAQRAVLLLAGLLGLAVLLIVGNTIRLAVLNRRDEIEVIKLIGGTDAFIRRPFLYSGLQQGLLGAVLAWLLVGLGLLLLSGPIRELAGLYGSEFRVAGLDVASSLTLLGLGGLLGWLGSRIAVGRHLRDIEPS